MKNAERIRRGNIVVNKWQGEQKIGRYLGNGRFGAVMSATGLNLSPKQQEDPSVNSSHFRHMRHWGRFNLTSPFTQEATSADYLLPLFRIFWEKDIEKISRYSQCQDFYDGVLSTDFTPVGGESLHVTSWFDSLNQNLASFIVDLPESACSNHICLSPITNFNPWPFMCREEYSQSVEITKEKDQWKIGIHCPQTVNQIKTDIYVRTNMAVDAAENRLAFSLNSGRNTLLISVGEPVENTTAEESLRRTIAQNHIMWDQVGWLDYPDQEVHNVYVRSMSYLLTSYDADCEYIQPANSMGINGFPYNFVPDIGNVAPALMMLGRWDIVKHWVEKFSSEIEDMRRYARFLWPESAGIFPPWELNFGPYEGYHAPTAPMIFFYEAHNTGYLAKLAMEALEHSNDDEWSIKYVHPLIEECAKFFYQACHKENDGLWHLTWYPCMGRDEAGGVNKDDYLCTLITAKYTFKAAIQCGLDKDEKYAKVLSEGLAFRSLLSEKGTLHTCRGADDFGKQKHPVQLEGVACFPTEAHPLQEEIAAYHLRHDITAGAKVPLFYGWTLAQLLMVDTNMRNYDEWRKDWAMLRPSNNTDDMWIQFYESSGMNRSAFYTATHGMVLQSLIRNCVNDYWGRLEIGGCLPVDSVVSFGNIKTRLGVTVSGQVAHNKATGTIFADRDTTFEFQNQLVSLKHGDTMDFEIMI